MKYIALLFLLSGCYVSQQEDNNNLSVLERNSYVYEEIDSGVFNDRNSVYCERTNETLKFFYNDASIKLTVPIWCDTTPYKFKGDPSPLKR